MRSGWALRALGAVMGLLVLMGTASVATATSDQADDGCEDPHPCEPAWPEGMSGHFELKGVSNVQVRSHDGTVLDGWIASPTVPPDVRTPTVLTVSPYFDSQYTGEIDRNPSTPPDPDCEITKGGCGYWYDGPMSPGVRTHSLGFAPIRLIQQGYTLAYFSVRGTGSSGGCFEYGGRAEQLDQVALVDWLAQQPWSNGRVGMAGLSYMSYTAWQAAVQAPPALKTVITAGDITDLYQMGYSPQGSRVAAYNDVLLAEYETERGVTGGVLSGRTDFLQHQACPRGGLLAQEVASLATGDRNAAYWQERNISLRLPSVRAAVLDTTGYKDVVGHQFQGDPVWGSLRESTPKLQVRGWWAHEFPGPEGSVATEFNLPSGTVTWETVVVRWLDYWLKGVGPAPRKDQVLHQDQDFLWHEDRSWSPERSGKEVLYLTGQQLTPDAQPGATSFVAAPAPDAAWGQHAANVESVAGIEGVESVGIGVESSLCQDPAGAALARVYLSGPVTSPTLLAGNPFAYLRLSSDAPGGLVTASLFDLGPEFNCTGPRFEGARWMSSGSADLSFFNSPFAARPFPVATPTQVRIDLSDLTYTLAPGHRLALELSHGSLFEHYGTSQFPTITVLGGATDASHLVVPVAGGTLGGQRPTQHYPQRPFTPRGYRD